MSEHMDISTIRLPGKNGGVKIPLVVLSIFAASLVYVVVEIVKVMKADAVGPTAGVVAAQESTLILRDIRDSVKDQGKQMVQQTIQMKVNGFVLEEIRDDMKNHVEHERDEHH